MNQYKTCCRCKQTKSRSDFNLHRSGADGLQSRCRDCERIVRRAYYEKNKDREIARVSVWHKTTEKGKANRVLYGTSKQPNRKRTSVYVPIKDLDPVALQRQRIKSARGRLRRRAAWKNAEKLFVSSKELARLYAQPCYYCGSVDRITIDHVVPLARGGRHSIGNLISACHKCNSTKHARFITEWRLNKPRADSLRRADPWSF